MSAPINCLDRRGAQTLAISLVGASASPAPDDAIASRSASSRSGQWTSVTSSPREPARPRAATDPGPDAPCRVDPQSSLARAVPLRGDGLGIRPDGAVRDARERPRLRAARSAASRSACTKTVRRPASAWACSAASMTPSSGTAGDQSDDGGDAPPRPRRADRSVSPRRRRRPRHVGDALGVTVVAEQRTPHVSVRIDDPGMTIVSAASTPPPRRGTAGPSRPPRSGRPRSGRSA